MLHKIVSYGECLKWPGYQMATPNVVSFHKKRDGNIRYIAEHGVYHKQSGICVVFNWTSFHTMSLYIVNPGTRHNNRFIIGIVMADVQNTLDLYSSSS